MFILLLVARYYIYITSSLDSYCFIFLSIGQCHYLVVADTQPYSKIQDYSFWLTSPRYISHHINSHAFSTLYFYFSKSWNMNSWMLTQRSIIAITISLIDTVCYSHQSMHLKNIYTQLIETFSTTYVCICFNTGTPSHIFCKRRHNVKCH